MNETMEAVLEQLREPWEPVSLPQFGAASAALAVLAAAYLTSREGWIPVLDSLNLVFHEAGHPVFSFLGETIHALGGTLMQVLVPLMVAGHFAWRRQALGTGLGLAWASQNLWNIARYMADARDQILPLVGGDQHDWGTLFAWWGCLDSNLRIAAVVRTLGWLGFLSAWVWLARRAWVAQSSPARRF